MSYDLYYSKYGIYKPESFLEPSIIKANTFTFPDNTVLFWFKCSDGIERISTQYPYLTKTSRAKIITIVKYGKNIEGVYQDLNSEEIEEALKLLIKKEKKFTFLEPEKIINQDKDIIILNYGILNYLYKYNPNSLNNLYKFNNTFYRMLEDIKLFPSKQKFILIDIPDKLPTIQELDNLSSGMTVGKIEKIPNYKYFLLIELWKFLTPKFKSSSIFNKFLTKDLENITLCLTYENKVVILNLGYLYSLIEEYKDKSYDVTIEAFKSESVYTSKSVRELFYILIYKILNFTPEDIKSIDYSKKIYNFNNIEKSISKIIKNNNLETKAIIDSIKNDELGDLLDLNDDNDEFDYDSFFKTDDIDINDALIKKNVNETYASIEELKKFRPEEEIKNKMLSEANNLLETGVISKAIYNKYIDALNRQDNLENPYIKSKDDPIQTIGDCLNYSLDDLDIKDTDKMIADEVIIFDKSLNEDTISAMDGKYIREKYRKDIIRSVMGLRNANIVIEDYTIEEDTDITGSLERHTIKALTLSGRRFTIRMMLPVINDDGTYTIYGNTYIIRKQRSELPIIKNSPTSVLLTSYYGKIFVTKADKKEDVGKWFSKTLLKQANTDKQLKNIIPGSTTKPEMNVPNIYGQICRNIKSFNYGDAEFTFNYGFRHELCNMDIRELEKLEQDMTFIGKIGNNLLFLDNTNTVFEYNGKDYKNIGDFFSIINMDITDMPIEFANVTLGFNVALPMVFLLSYYLGLENLLKLLKVKYELYDEGKRVQNNSNIYGVRFKDKTLIIYSDKGVGDIILAGLIPYKKVLKELNFKYLNNRLEFGLVLNTILSNLSSIVHYETKIKILEKLFIDPITISTLRLIKEPENFPGLLIRAAELLTNEKYSHPNDLKNRRIKGYERVAGIVYREIVMALEEYEKKNQFSRTSFEMNEYEILKVISGDSSKVPMDDLNPIAFLKQKEDTTLLGLGGRNKDGLTKPTREVHESEIGFISEATKDSTDVGITAFMSSNPKIDSITGVVKEVKNEELGWGNILSTTAMLSPFGMTDDPKRLNFSSIHSGHVVPMVNMRIPYVITGYEIHIAKKVGNKFATCAEDDGEVISVSKSEIKVKYNKLGEKSYKIYTWTSKEETDACYTHKLVSNLEKGQKFYKDDVLVYDSSFFKPCIFNPRKVLYMQGDVVNVMFNEEPGTYEDSVIISKELHSRLATNVTSVRTIVLNKTDQIFNVVNINDKVNPDTPLMSITSEGILNDGYDAKTLAILSELNKESPKAKYKGVVNKIIVYYNFDKEEASDSIKQIIEYSDSNLLKIYNQTGQIKNNKYSVKNKPLLPGECVIKIYIESETKMGTGDKCILASQLKCTVGEVFNSDMETSSGRKIDAVFGFVSIQARIVNSAILMGTTGGIVQKIEEKAIDIYFK